MIVLKLSGKIDSVRHHGGNCYTRVIAPADDPYSRPDVVEVRSKAPVGSVGQMVTLDCALHGYVRKPYKFTDPQTGEIRVVVPVDYSLEVLV